MLHIDAVYIKNPVAADVEKLKKRGVEIVDDDFLSKMHKVNFVTLTQSVDELSKIRKAAIVDRDEKFSNTTYVKLCGSDFFSICSIASALVCKYANMLIFEEFDEALFASLNEEVLFSKIMGFRATKVSKIKDKSMKEYYKKMQQYYALPDMRTEEQKEEDFAEALW